MVKTTLTYFGNAGNDTLNGLKGDDSLSGGTGDESLNSGLGQDTLAGGTGNDTYTSDGGGDVIEETSTLLSEIDTVNSPVSFSLGENLENLVLTGFSPTSGNGNSLNNQIIGNAASNKLSGDSGNDTLTGNRGNDTLRGGIDNDLLLGNNGDDNLAGGSGNDTLIGGSNFDIFYFESPLEETDTITDFNVAQDTIQVLKLTFGGGLVEGALTTEQFVVGSAAVDGSTRFIYNKNIGGLFFDTDGTGSTAQIQIAKLSANLRLTNLDIVVV